MNTIADTFTLFAPRWAQSLIHSHVSKLFHWNHWFFIVHSHFSASQAKPWFSLGFLKIDQKSLFSKRWYCRTFFAPRSPKYGYIRTFSISLFHSSTKPSEIADTFALFTRTPNFDNRKWAKTLIHSRFLMRLLFFDHLPSGLQETRKKNKRNHRFWNLPHAFVEHLCSQMPG